ncbi:hypothetical protein SLA2020_196210 [Shorea laevis]
MAANRVVSSVENINCLPAEVLCHILSFLPTKDAVRTSFVSRRWRYLYTLVSNLDFELRPDYGDDSSVNQLMNFVDRVLLFHIRPSVVRFCLKWIRAVMWYGIEELELDITEFDINLEFLPASLFTCETLVVLKLCLVPAMTVLSSYPRLFSGCPVLEVLIPDDCCARYDRLKFEVSNPTIKRFFIRKMRYEGVTPQTVINAPILVYFSFSELELHHLVFVNMQSLCEAVIDFNFWFDSANYAAAVNDLLAGITSVQSLQISIQTLECLQDCQAPIPLWSNMTRLKIFGLTECYDFACVQYFLSCSYCLETLIIEWLPKDWDLHFGLDVTCLSFHLKTIEILSFQAEEACMKMVEYFLSNAKVLEEMTIHIVAEKEQQLKTPKELLTLPRVSSKCRVKLCL